MSAKDAVLQRTGSHWIDDGPGAAEGIRKEEVFLYFSAKWRSAPVIVTMHADRYSASHWDADTDTSTDRLVAWRIYASETRFEDPEKNGGRGEHTTGTARSALSKLCEPLVVDWLSSDAYAASFQKALAHMIMRKFRDDYSVAHYVTDALATFKSRLAAELYQAIRETLVAYSAFEDAKARAFEVINAE